MTTQRVLLCSPFFFPEPIATGRYTTALADALVARGCAVTVVCSHPLHPDWKPKRTAAQRDGVKIVRGGAWLRYPHHQIGKRVVLEVWYATRALWWAWRLRNETDVAVVVLPPNLSALCLRWVIGAGTPLVGIVHDLQAVYFARRRFASGWFGREMTALEGRTLAVCDRLIFLSRSMRDWAAGRWSLDGRQCQVIYPPVSVNMTGDDSSGRGPEALRPACVNVVYSGALGEKHEADRLVEFFEQLVTRRSDICCHIFSRGAEFDRVRDATLRRPDAKTCFHDLVPAQELPALYADSAVQVIPQAPGTAHASLPSKLPNIIGSGVPAFVICDEGSEAGELAVASGIGCAVHDWSTDVLCERMLAFLNEQAGSTHTERRQRVASYVSEHFSLERLVDGILAVTNGH